MNNQLKLIKNLTQKVEKESFVKSLISLQKVESNVGNTVIQPFHSVFNSQLPKRAAIDQFAPTIQKKGFINS